jgi:hypothetical protein
MRFRRRAVYWPISAASPPGNGDRQGQLSYGSNNIGFGAAWANSAAGFWFS